MLESAAEAQGHFPREARGGAATPAEPRGPAGRSRGTPGGDIPTATPSRHLPAAGTQPCGGRTRSRPCSAQRTPPGHPHHQHATMGDTAEVCAISPAELAQSVVAVPTEPPRIPEATVGLGGRGGDSMTPRGWCHRSSGSANHPGRKSSSCCWRVLKEDQDGDPVALSVAPSLSPALGIALALCWAPGNPRQSCSPVLHLQADAAELQPALCTSATSFNLGQEEHSPAFLMGMYCIPGLLCSLPG